MPDLHPVKTPPHPSRFGAAGEQSYSQLIISDASAWACLHHRCAAQRLLAGRKAPAIP